MDVSCVGVQGKYGKCSYTAETSLQPQIKLSKKFKRIAGIAWVLVTGGEQ